jgi:hypothetical protein
MCLSEKRVLKRPQLNQLSGTTPIYTDNADLELIQLVQGATTTESYSYDEVGNRLSSAGNASVYLQLV